MNLEASLVKVYCCKQCGKELTAENWSPSHQRKSYYICNQCHCIRSREWLQNHKDHHKEYRQQNKETINQTKREWCARNKDKIKEYGKRHYGKNKEIILEAFGFKIYKYESKLPLIGGHSIPMNIRV